MPVFWNTVYLLLLWVLAVAECGRETFDKVIDCPKATFQWNLYRRMSGSYRHFHTILRDGNFQYCLLWAGTVLNVFNIVFINSDNDPNGAFHWGPQTTSAHNNQNSNSFSSTDNMNGVSNPIVVNFDSWPVCIDWNVNNIRLLPCYYKVNKPIKTIKQ